MNNVHDFIYLDHRRVLSFGSQLLEGLANSISVTKENKKVSEKKVETKAKIHGDLSIGDDSSKLLYALVGLLGKGSIGVSGEINPIFSSINTLGENRTEQRLLDHF